MKSSAEDDLPLPGTLQEAVPLQEELADQAARRAAREGKGS